MSERQFEIPLDGPVVTRDGASARQWEAFLMRDAVRHGAAAWRTPAVKSYRAWLFDAAATAGLEPILTPAQSAALWRRVIDASPERADLIDVAGPAGWAAEAAALLTAWQVPADWLLAAPDEPDFRAFLAWRRRYRDELDARGWRDAAGLEAELPPPPLARLVLADLDDPLPPATAALVARLEAAGTAVARVAAPRAGGRHERLAARNADEEIDLAVDWAAARLRAAPSARLALVIGDLDAHRRRLERILPAALGGSSWSDPGRATLADDPAAGAALAALELLTGGGFAALSVWLRSPPLGDPRSGPWARLEARLRGEPLAQLDFVTAFRHGGLRPLLEDTAPELASAFAAALRDVGARPGERRTPSAWAAAWQRALRLLGWPLEPLDEARLGAWEAALAELRRLTPVLGAIGAADALRELDAIVAAQRLPSPQPASGLYLLERPEDVGPGFDGAWVTGFTGTEWPRPPRPNPLLPRRLQVAHAMPWSSPRDALERSERILARLVERVPELIVSWPREAREHETEPSPLIDGWPERVFETIRVAVPERLALEELIDRPPPLAGSEIRGGVGALNKQARAPLRAFCEHRLGARELEPFALGLSARLRGIAAHRALELAYAPAVGGAALDLSRERLADCAATALAEVFGPARRSLAALFRLEHEQLVAALERVAAAEASRSPFTVEAVERRAEVAVGGRTLRVRIDRVDRLADGTLAVLDYKTGRANPGDWLKARLQDAQVPLYAVHAGENVTAAVLVALDASVAPYRGIWRDDAFPGRPRTAIPWPDQLRTWRLQLEELVHELVGGDARVFVADLELVSGAYAPLTRIREQLELARAEVGL